MIAAALSFVGLINAEEVAWNASPPRHHRLPAAGRDPRRVRLRRARETSTGELDDGLLFVNGTLMRGLELHGNLAGAELLEETRTAPVYRVHSIGDVHPGMYRADDGGASISGELYAIPIETLLRVDRGRAAWAVPRAGRADRRPGGAGHPLRRGHRQDASRDHRAGWLAGVPRFEV